MFYDNFESSAFLAEPAVFRAGKRVVWVGNRDKITGFPSSALRYLPTDIIIHNYSMVPLQQGTYYIFATYEKQLANNCNLKYAYGKIWNNFYILYFIGKNRQKFTYSFSWIPSRTRDLHETRVYSLK